MIAPGIQFRPMLQGVATKALPAWKRINWAWMLQRAPMLLFAMVSSYGVGHLLSIKDIPFPVDYFGAVAFDLGYLGAIALADMQLSRSMWSHIAYYALNIVMSGLAALFNVLSLAGGNYQDITLEHVTIGAPFALVGLTFALYYHSVMRAHIELELKRQQMTAKKVEQAEKAALERQRKQEEYEREYPFVCVCRLRFKTNVGKRNHQRSCTIYKS